MPTPAFNRAVALTLISEGGGLYTKATADRGGATRWGISIATLSGYRGKPCTDVDVKNLTQAEAEAIYETRYWNPLKCDDYASEAFAAGVFDCGVLTGTANAARTLQASVGAVVDGIIGPKTIAAVRASDKLTAACAFSVAWQKYLVSIVQRDRTQSVFLNSWLRRAATMQTYIFSFSA